ncbi:DUF2797 domain-containing protein [Phytomonospora endophytica]|uniref:DUF2797 domain-containing protein n=1 Tax=Phytomonospora endophytica TaxID=714109 RepID=A0A841FLZ0_9ACTN|nr:DUF2797 domain-containing protein [Phytomonospora endophytica]MBB6037166.1 hypothetical protein [Phytomonospora endophytica]GIG71206.1 hypothetical protein Pen01_75010 [Phytomonospora endophytica]
MPLPTWPHTGVTWADGRASLCFTSPEGRDEHVPLALGERISWRLPGVRRCIGVWIPSTRRRVDCPHQRVLPTARAAAQCDPCERTDPGKALARGQALDDPRDFRLYLAYFGPGLVKVGLTAVDRGQNRLTEQAALAYTWLATGPLRPIRRAEMAASATKLATERLRHRTKTRGRWHPAFDAATELGEAHRRLAAVIAGELTVEPFAVTDLRPTYGLPGTGRPEREVTDIEYDACLTGVLRCLAGRDAVLDTEHGTLLVDLRLLAGRTILDGEGAPTDGVDIALLDLGRTPAPEQDTLF